jgi:hypothetical protein
MGPRESRRMDCSVTNPREFPLSDYIPFQPSLQYSYINQLKALVAKEVYRFFVGAKILLNRLDTWSGTQN